MVAVDKGRTRRNAKLTRNDAVAEEGNGGRYSDSTGGSRWAKSRQSKGTEGQEADGETSRRMATSTSPATPVAPKKKSHTLLSADRGEDGALLSALKDMIAKALVQNVQILEENKRLSWENEQLGTQLGALQDQNQDLRSQLGGLQDQMDEMKTQIDDTHLLVTTSPPNSNLTSLTYPSVLKSANSTSQRCPA